MIYKRYKLIESIGILSKNYEIVETVDLENTVQHPSFDVIADFINENYKIYVASIKTPRDAKINVLTVVEETLVDNKWEKLNNEYIICVVVKELRLNQWKN